MAMPDENGGRTLAALQTEVNSLKNEVGLLRQRQATPWATLISAAGFLVVILGIIGGLALAPLQQQAGNNKDAIEALEGQVVPRGENAEHWRASDQRASELQRQLDELKAASASVYSVRDALMDLKARLDKIEGKP